MIDTDKVRGERERFEKWARPLWEAWSFERIPEGEEPSCGGQYVSAGLESAWNAWQARGDSEKMRGKSTHARH